MGGACSGALQKFKMIVMSRNYRVCTVSSSLYGGGYACLTKFLEQFAAVDIHGEVLSMEN